MNVDHFKVEKRNPIGGTPVFRAALLANTELILSGYCDGTNFPFGTAAEVAYIRDDGGAFIAIMVWRVEDGEAWIQFAWVEFAWRRKGLYTRLFNAVCEECRERKVTKIESFVYAHNEGMQACAAKNGRVVTKNLYTKTFNYEVPA